MKLSPDVENKFRQMALHQELQPQSESPQELAAALATKALTMVVGPAAIGKTYVMQRIAELDARFGLASSITNRDRRVDDPQGLFRHYFERNNADTIELLEKFHTGTLVSYYIHPTELTFYGNEVVDFPHEVNMLATLSGAIDTLRSRGFGRTAVIGLVSSPEDWLGHFNARYHANNQARYKRLQEGRGSLADLLERPDTNWVVNRNGHGDVAAQDIIRIVDGTHSNSAEALAFAREIRQKIDDELTGGYTEQDD